MKSDLTPSHGSLVFCSACGKNVKPKHLFWFQVVKDQVDSRAHITCSAECFDESYKIVVFGGAVLAPIREL